MDRNKWGLPLVDSDWCQTVHEGVDQEYWESMCNTLREVAKKVGIKEVGERTSLLCKLSARKRAGELCFDENMTGQITNRTQERKMGGIVGRCFADVQREKWKEEQRTVRRTVHWKTKVEVHLA